MQDYENNALEKAEQIANEKQNMTRREERARIKLMRKQERDRLSAVRFREKNKRRAEVIQKRQTEQAMREQQRQRQKQEKNKNKKGGKGGYVAAIITLSIATLVLASVLTMTYLLPSTKDNMLESAYSRAFYNTVKEVDNIDSNLAKILATSDEGAMQKYLVDTAINAELAENEIGQLPLQDQSKFYTTKLINQIGDYSKFLNNKLIEKKVITSEEMKNVEKLYKANLTLKNSLNEMTSKMGMDFSFSSLIDGGNSNIVIKGFNDLQNISVDYPELIYDGPFSDGQSDKTIKGLPEQVISKEVALETFKSIFGEYKLENIASVGEVSGDVEAYNVQGELMGEVLFAQISKKGGKLLMFSYGGSCTKTQIGEDDAIATAKEFLTKQGINDMQEVWINLANNVYTINFASETQGVICYPDLVKVRVCAETNKVIGQEAKSYYSNHTERHLRGASLSRESAIKKLSDNIEVYSSRLCIVPDGVQKETLCYEFMGEYNGQTYYVYIDATNGRQVEMFRVIEGTEGKLLI